MNPPVRFSHRTIVSVMTPSSESPGYLSWLFALPDSYLLGMAAWLFLLVVLAAAWLNRLVHWRRHPRRMVLLKVLFSAWLFAALLTAIELYFALIFDGTDAFNVTNVSRAWEARHITPYERVLAFSNGEGMIYRDDRPFPSPVPKDQRHLCFLGDSFTFGHGVADVDARFSNRIREALERDRPGAFVVSNLAEPGKDLRWSTAVVERLIADGILVDILVYVLCLNDIEAYHPNHMKMYEQLADLEPRTALLRSTYFPNMLYYRTSIASIPEARDYYGFLADYYQGEPWQQMAADLQKLQSLCEKHQIELRVVLFPFLQRLGEDTTFDDARSVVAKFSAERGIPFQDLTAALLPHRDEGLVVNRFDAHPNARAHAIAADALKKGLLADLWQTPNASGRGSDEVAQ